MEWNYWYLVAINLHPPLHQIAMNSQGLCSNYKRIWILDIGIVWRSFVYVQGLFEKGWKWATVEWKKRSIFLQLKGTTHPLSIPHWHLFNIATDTHYQYCHWLTLSVYPTDTPFPINLVSPLPCQSAHSLFAQDRESILEAFPGDVIGIHNPGHFAIGDTIYTGSKRITYPGIPSFSPEKFAYLRNPNQWLYKKFQKWLSELLDEGLTQTISDLYYLFPSFSNT